MKEKQASEEAYVEAGKAGKLGHAALELVQALGDPGPVLNEAAVDQPLQELLCPFVHLHVATRAVRPYQRVGARLGVGQGVGDGASTRSQKSRTTLVVQGTTTEPASNQSPKTTQAATTTMPTVTC